MSWTSKSLHRLGKQSVRLSFASITTHAIEEVRGIKNHLQSRCGAIWTHYSRTKHATSWYEQGTECELTGGGPKWLDVAEWCPEDGGREVVAREGDRGRGLIRGDTSFPCVLIPATASANTISCYQLLATTGLHTQVACVSAGILYNDVSNAPWGGIARIFPSIEPSGRFGPCQPRPLHTKYDRSRHDHSSFPASGPAAHCDCPSWTNGVPRGCWFEPLSPTPTSAIFVKLFGSPRSELHVSLFLKSPNPRLDVETNYFLSVEFV
jgi:hypothetical protein